jgi:hypothetical protein
MADEAKKKADGPAAPPTAAAAAGHGDKGGDKHDAPKAGKGGAAGAGAMLAKTPVLLGGVMILEAAVLFAGFKFLGGGPKSAPGAQLTENEPAAVTTEEHGAASASAGGHSSGGGEHGGAAGPAKPVDGKKSVEVQVIDFRAPNKQSGRTFLYDVTIFASTKAQFKDRVETTINERGALIKDRIRTIIAQSDPEKLGGGSEPGLETLRRQVKYQLDDIIGEGMVEEVLIPRCIPIRADF